MINLTHEDTHSQDSLEDPTFINALEDFFQDHNNGSQEASLGSNNHKAGSDSEKENSGEDFGHPNIGQQEKVKKDLERKIASPAKGRGFEDHTYASSGSCKEVVIPSGLGTDAAASAELEIEVAINGHEAYKEGIPNGQQEDNVSHSQEEDSPSSAHQEAVSGDQKEEAAIVECLEESVPSGDNGCTVSNPIVEKDVDLSDKGLTCAVPSEQHNGHQEEAVSNDQEMELVPKEQEEAFSSDQMEKEKEDIPKEELKEQLSIAPTVGLKRPLESPTSDSKDSKRLKLEETIDESANLDAEWKLERFTRSELEKLAHVLLMENVNAHSEVAKLRSTFEANKKQIEHFKSRALSYHKQLQDLTLVMHKHISEVKSASNNSDTQKIEPVKIRRSVGLQVKMAVPGHQQQSLESPVVKQSPQKQQQKAEKKKSPSGVRKSPRTAADETKGRPSLPEKVLEKVNKVSQSQPRKSQAIQKPANAANSNKVLECVDLSSEDNESTTKKSPMNKRALQRITANQPAANPAPRHPAPLPIMSSPQPMHPSWKRLPPKPSLAVSKRTTGIILSWNMAHNPSIHAEVLVFQIFAYQETADEATISSLWKSVGDVKALPLPMACTLSQFQRGHTYYFSVRAKDVYNRISCFSDPQSITI